jgi:glucose uptake protein GlcU
MLDRTPILALAAAAAIAAGVAASFFELTALGVITAIVTVALWLTDKRTRETPSR